MTGKELMQLRIFQGKSLEAAAAEYGVTVAQLASIEQSDAAVPARAQRQMQAVKLPRGPDSRRGKD